MAQNSVDAVFLVVQSDEQPARMCSELWSMMTDASFVDLTLLCGNSTIFVHKCILAAGSNYFKEQFQLHPEADEVIINDVDFNNLLTIIQFIYCGESICTEANYGHILTAAKTFQIRGLQVLKGPVESITIPTTIFITKGNKCCTCCTNPAAPVNPKGPEALDDGSHSANMGPPLEPMDMNIQYNVCNPSRMVTNAADADISNSSLIPIPFVISADGEQANNDYSTTCLTDIDVMYEIPNMQCIPIPEHIRKCMNNDIAQLKIDDQIGSTNMQGQIRVQNNVNNNPKPVNGEVNIDNNEKIIIIVVDENPATNNNFHVEQDVAEGNDYIDLSSEEIAMLFQLTGDNLPGNKDS